MEMGKSNQSRLLKMLLATEASMTADPMDHLPTLYNKFVEGLVKHLPELLCASWW